MKDLLPLPTQRQFWITTPQLGALAIITLSLSALAFFLGVMVGRGQAPAEGIVTTNEVSSGLVDDELMNDTITELLAKVEQAASRREAHAGTELTFPDQLVGEEEVQIPEPLEEEEPAVAVLEPDPGPGPRPDGVEVPERPEEQETAEEGTAEEGTAEEQDGIEEALESIAQEVEAVASTEEPEREFPVPDSGWAVQVASYTEYTEANSRVEELTTAGHGAWLVQAFAMGKNRYRVRIGPFESEEQARSAREQLGVDLAEQDLMVTRNE